MGLQEDFIAKIAPIIQQYAIMYGYKVCSPIIAQAFVESKYGESLLGKIHHNYFGMKANKYWSGKTVKLKTKEEYVKGKLTEVYAEFRAYDSMEAGVKGYFDFISTSRYSNLKSAVTPQQYLEYIKADGYATSSTYVQTNMNAVNAYNLTKYDTMQAPAPDMKGKDIRKVTATKLNARLSPMGTKLFMLDGGELVNVVDEKDGWCRIEAWVSNQYLVK